MKKKKEKFNNIFFFPPERIWVKFRLIVFIPIFSGGVDSIKFYAIIPTKLLIIYVGEKPACYFN